MLLLTAAAHVVPPLPVAPLDKALNRQGLHTLLVCCLHANLQKNPLAQETGYACATPPPLYPAHTEDVAGIPTKPTARGEDFRVQMERNVNSHPPHRYCLSTHWHPVDNLPIPPMDHCWQQRNPFVGSSLRRQHCCCVCLGDPLLRTTVQEPRLQNPNPLFKVRVHPLTGSMFQPHQFFYCPFPCQLPIPLPVRKPLRHPYHKHLPR